MTPAQRTAATLAGLRLLQHEMHHGIPDRVYGILAEAPPAPTITELDELCEEINTEQPNLAAAAPDMLAALKLLQAALTEYNLRDVKKRFSLCVADAGASSAIAKAEGRAP